MMVMVMIDDGDGDDGDDGDGSSPMIDFFPPRFLPDGDGDARPQWEDDRLPRFLPDLPVMISHSTPLPIRFIHLQHFCSSTLSAAQCTINGWAFLFARQRQKLKADMFTWLPLILLQYQLDYSVWFVFM